MASWPGSSSSAAGDVVSDSFDGLDLQPVLAHLDLVAEPVAAALTSLPTGALDGVMVAEIDPDLADTGVLTAALGLPLEASANCVVVAGKRGGEERFAACVVLATTRADVNNVVRRRLDVRKASFAPHDTATAASRMEHGGITPIGLPAGWPILVDTAVIGRDRIILGSGLRRSKIVMSGTALAGFPNIEVIEGLGRPVEPSPG